MKRSMTTPRVVFLQMSTNTRPPFFNHPSTFHAPDLFHCDVACKAMWQSHVNPRGCLCGAEVARMRGSATRVHADAQVAPRDSVRGLGVMGPWVRGPR